MKHTLLTLTIASLFATTAFADPIHDAARKGDLAGVQVELDAGVDVDVRGVIEWTPLHRAADAGHEEVVELLIAAGADVNAKDENGNTPLNRAAYISSWSTGDGHKEVIELLIAAGADVSAKDRFGATPLHRAAWYGYTEIVELLIAAGAEVDARDNYKRTPLHEAAWDGSKEIVELLIANGADVNAKTDGGFTPLHYAAYNGHKETIELLITNGADVNAKIENGNTPLHLADTKQIAELLIAGGADMNAEDNQGRTPLNSAIEKLADLVEMFGDWGDSWLESEIQEMETLISYLKTVPPLLTTELTFTAVSESEDPTVYAMARGSGSCNGVDIFGSFVILYGSKYNLRIVKKSDGSSVFEADTQLVGNPNGVMTVALNEDLFSDDFSNTEELLAVPYDPVNGRWDTTEAVPVTRYRNLSFDAAKKTKAAQWQSAE